MLIASWMIWFIFISDNSDLISCTVITKDGQKIKGFMVIDPLQLILVDPDNKRVGWGIAKFVGFLQVSIYLFIFYFLKFCLKKLFL